MLMHSLPGLLEIVRLPYRKQNMEIEDGNRRWKQKMETEDENGERKHHPSRRHVAAHVHQDISMR